jgi:hypothetical protein
VADVTDPHAARRGLAGRGRTARGCDVTALVILTSVVGAFFWDALLLGRTLVLRDAHAAFVPLRTFLRERLLAGEMPFWNPYSFAGHPFFAHPEFGACYPPTYLLLPLGTRAWVHAYVMLHLVLLGWTLMVFVRALGVGRRAAVLAGTVAMLAGIPIKYLEFLSVIGGLAWMPAAFHFLRRTVLERRLAPALATALVLAMQLLAGNPYPSFYTVLGLALYAAFLVARVTVRERRVPVRALPLGALIVALMLGLAAIQLLPLRALLAEHAPPGGLGTVLPAAFSLHPVEWVVLLVPRFFGYPDWQKCFYLGVLPLLLIPIGLVHLAATRRGSRATAVAASEAGFFAGLMLLGLLLSLGEYVGVPALVAHALPLAGRMMKWPTTAMILFVFAGSVLTGVGADVVLGGGLTRPRGRALTLLGALQVAATVLVAGVLLADVTIVPGTLQGLRDAWAHHLLAVRSVDVAPALYPVRAEVLKALVLLVAALVVVWAVAGRRPTGRRGGAALLVLLVTDLLVFARPLVYFAAENLYEKETPNIARLRRAGVQDGPFRVLLLHPDGLNDLVYGSRTAGEFALVRDALLGSVGVPYGIFSADGSRPLPPVRYVSLLRAAERLPVPARDRLLGLYNVRYLIEVGREADGVARTRLTVNPDVAPRAYLVSAYRRVAGRREALAALAEAVDVRSRPVVEASEELPALDGGTPPGRVTGLVYTANTLAVTLATERPALLIIADSFAPGWEAEVDGTPTPIYEANFTQRAVYVGAGSRRVTLRYHAPGVRAGATITLASILACALLGVAARRRGR